MMCLPSAGPMQGLFSNLCDPVQRENDASQFNWASVMGDLVEDVRQMQADMVKIIQAKSVENEKLEKLIEGAAPANALKKAASIADATCKWKSLLIRTFPREASETSVFDTMKEFVEVESVKIVQKGGESKCFGFANFPTHAACREALEMFDAGKLVMTDPRGVKWTMKGEWAKGNGKNRKSSSARTN